MFSTAFALIAALLILGIIIMIHELGHYTAGRLLGFTILEFNIGMGPKAFSWRRNKIDYNLRWLPIGGSVRFVGEDEASDDPGAMNKQAAWKRFIVISAGAFMNIVLAIILAISMVGIYGGENYLPIIKTAEPGKPAALAGLLPGDVITSVNGYAVKTREDVSIGMEKSPDTVTMTVQRKDSGEHTFVLESQMDEQSGRKLIGITFERERYGFFETIGKGIEYAFDNVRQVLLFFGRLISFQIPQQELAESVGGPVMIGTVLVSAVRQGFEWVLMVATLISINLGVFNLLPLPALDGGRLVFILIEAIRGKPIPPEKEGMVHFVGLMLLLGVALLVTFKDISQLFVR